MAWSDDGQWTARIVGRAQHGIHRRARFINIDEYIDEAFTFAAKC